ncbi:MAG: hypothetical protein AAGD22_17825, partial [Verrucomicrobiota bacterium]
RWSDPIYGFLNGVFHVFIFGFVWIVYVLPWSLLILGLYRWRKWRRFRTQWVLAPAVLVFLMFLWSLAFYPPSAPQRFKSFAKTELPQNVKNLHFRFSGGGIGDFSDTYYFETTPDEVDRIIAEMNLAEDERFGREGMFGTSVSPLAGCPDFSTWIGAKQYRAWDDDQHWFYYVIVDSSRTKVYVLVGCI